MKKGTVKSVRKKRINNKGVKIMFFEGGSTWLLLGLGIGFCLGIMACSIFVQLYLG